MIGVGSVPVRHQIFTAETMKVDVFLSWIDWTGNNLTRCEDLYLSYKEIVPVETCCMINSKIENI